MENTTYPTPWRVAKNMDIYQVWRQIRALHPGEPMNSAVREYYPDAEFATRREAEEFARKLNGDCD